MKIIIDTETTGLDPFLDEILELCVLDADTGDVMINRRYGTRARSEWAGAERINHISPADVAGLAPFGDAPYELEIINRADLIIGWNVDFDIRMIEAAGIKVKPDRFDLMAADANVFGEITPDRRSGKYRKLADAAAWWGFDPQTAEQRYHVAEYHGALFDCAATREIYRRYQMLMGAEYNMEIKSKIVMCRNYLRSIQYDLHTIHTALMAASMRTDKDVETQGMLDMLLSDLRTIAGDTAVASGGLGGEHNG